MPPSAPAAPPAAMLTPSPAFSPLSALLEGLPALPGGSPVAAFIGGGGKTSLLFALAKVVAARGQRVISTTTTRIFPPTPEQTGQLLLTGTDGVLPLRALRAALARHGHATLAAGSAPGGKLAGISPALIQELSQSSSHPASQARLADIILVEADGAARHPLKAPAAHEPAVPACAHLCVAVCGLDGIGLPLATAAHRPDIAAQLCACGTQDMVTPAHLAHLVLHPEGLFRTCPPTAQRLALCHKADIPGGAELAQAAAQAARQLYPACDVPWWMGSAQEGWAKPLTPAQAAMPV